MLQPTAKVHLINNKVLIKCKLEQQASILFAILLKSKIIEEKWLLTQL